MTERSF
jgi:hypothetical protein